MNFYKNKNTFRILILIIFLFGKTGVVAQATLEGQVMRESGEPIEGVVMVFMKEGFIKGKVITDTNGYYRIKLRNGNYSIKNNSSFCYLFNRFESLILFDESDFYMDLIGLEPKEVGCDIFVLLGKEPTIFEMEQFSLTSKKIDSNPSRNIDGIFSISPGVTFSQ